MQRIKDWLKANWKSVSLASAIASMILAQFGIMLKATPENVTIVIPIDDEPTVLQGAAEGKIVQGRLFNKYFYTLARVKAASQLARDKATTFVEAYEKIRKVPDAEIEVAAKKAGIDPAQGLGDGTLLKKIIDWFSDPENQAKLKALIEFIIAMALMFAQAAPEASWACSLSHWNC